VAERIRNFWSPEVEDRFIAAYEAVLKQWPVPYNERYVPTPFGDTHVIQSGPADAPPLVLLHPAGGGSTIWYRNAGAFSQAHRMLAVDVVGDINRSKLTRRIRSRQDFADWINELFDGLGIDTADMIGNSNGGFVVLNAAYYLPERVRRVVLISPAATFVPIPSIFIHTIIPGYWFAPIFRWEGLCHQAADWIWQDFPMDDCMRNLRRLAQVSGYPRFRPTLNPPPSVFTDEELRKIKSPVLLLIGDHEVLYNREAVFRRASRLVPRLRAEVVPNANHCAQYTAPEFVNQQVLAFLAE
jgi:pimeloyl-ACP methyl ester carboxylesterase